MKEAVMKVYYLFFLASISIFGFFSGLFSSQSGLEISKIYEKKEIIRIETVSADCILMPESIDVIKVHFHEADGSGYLEYGVQEEADRLIVQEYVPASSAVKAGDDYTGSSTVTVTVPEGVTVQFYSLSGNLQAAELTADLSASTGTGDIDVTSVVGRLALESGTGKVTVGP
jgi:hypothetical protein